MRILTIRDADAYSRLWTDLEGREEVLEDIQGDTNPVRRLMDWIEPYNTTPLVLPVHDEDVANEIQAAIESMELSFDDGAEGVELS